MTTASLCPECGEREPSRVHITRCAFRAALLDDLAAHAEHLDESPSRAQIAHMATLWGDETRAANAARKVLELGWRPVVGGDAS